MFVSQSVFRSDNQSVSHFRFSHRSVSLIFSPVSQVSVNPTDLPVRKSGRSVSHIGLSLCQSGHDRIIRSVRSRSVSQSGQVGRLIGSQLDRLVSQSVRLVSLISLNEQSIFFRWRSGSSNKIISRLMAHKKRNFEPRRRKITYF